MSGTAAIIFSLRNFCYVASHWIFDCNYIFAASQMPAIVSQIMMNLKVESVTGLTMDRDEIETRR